MRQEWLFDAIYLCDIYERITAYFSRIVDERIPLSARAAMAHFDKPYVKVEGIDMLISNNGNCADMMLRAFEFEEI